MKKLVTIFLMLAISGCQSAKTETKRDMPPIEWVEIKPIPATGGGSVVPLPAEASTEEEKAAMRLLGIPFDGYVLSPDKLEAAVQLRLYSEQLHANAVFNTNLGKVWSESMWRELGRADKALDEIVSEQNTWWYRNKDTVIFGAGFTLGAASAILIAFGLNQALE